MVSNKILIVDNEPDIVHLLSIHLKREGFDPIGTTDSQKVLGIIHREQPDMILLDVVMPGMNGIDLCARIREEYDTPILFLSCKSEVSDKVLGLSIGGDDYITKPFSMAEVIARIKVNLRKKRTAQSGEADSVMCVNGIRADMDEHTVTADNNAMNLTSKEFDLLVLLMSSPNRVFTVRQIFERLWDTYGYENDYRTVMVHISNLRKKIDASLKEGRPNPIQNVRSVGYKFVSP
ncbi:MAG: response regulator transcription factor [Clostridiales Family XIII bacterium]|jgi:DNA-binding response OmpR family regulator|nr:response regulator transcription factor [Clostridiales Family XIII bacterium]